MIGFDTLRIWPVLKDWLFRMGLYWGVRLPCPVYLFSWSHHFDGQIIQAVDLFINEYHEMAQWLIFCEGPWKLTYKKKKGQSIPYLAFARIEDAVEFQILLSNI